MKRELVVMVSYCILSDNPHIMWLIHPKIKHFSLGEGIRDVPYSEYSYPPSMNFVVLSF